MRSHSSMVPSSPASQIAKSEYKAKCSGSIPSSGLIALSLLVS
jgi:hypothetical protein